MPLDSLIPYVGNARKHDAKNIQEIASSIIEYGFNDPIAINEVDSVIIEGHGRLLAAKSLGLETVPVIKLGHLTKAQIKGYTLAHNRIAEKSEWDKDILANELEKLNEMDFDIDLTGFDSDSLDELDLKLGDEPEYDSEKDDIIPEPKEENEFKVERGDIWILGNHRLVCGDSTDKADVDKLMDGAKADMVFTDPPYGMNLDTSLARLDKQKNLGTSKKGGNPKTKDHKAVIGDDQDFDPRPTLQLFDYCKEIFLFGFDYYMQMLPKNGSVIVWDKHCQDGDTKIPYGNEIELCWSKTKHRKYICKIQWTGIGGVKDDTNAKPRTHPTQKPVQLPTWFLGKWGKDKNLIVDLFLGSGSTLIACEKTNRQCYGMEIDPHYCSVIIKRWQDYTGKEAHKC